MKEQLIQLAKDKGFVSHIIGKSVSAEHTIKDFYYLWLCELQKWLRDTHHIYLIEKPITGSKNGYDSYPIIGWDYDLIMLNKNSKNSFYMGYPILDWFTGIMEKDETLEDYNIALKKTVEDAIEEGLKQALTYIK
jgi:hypothetical protein